MLKKIQDLNSPFLIKLIKASDPDSLPVEPPQCVIILEFINGEDMEQAYKPDKPKPSEKIYIDLIYGLNDISNAGIVHHDIKPENLMLDKIIDDVERAVYIDFAFVQEAGEKSNQGSYGYWTEGEGREVDIWSLGISIWEISIGGFLPGEMLTLADNNRLNDNIKQYQINNQIVLKNFQFFENFPDIFKIFKTPYFVNKLNENRGSRFFLISFLIHLRRKELKIFQHYLIYLILKPITVWKNEKKILMSH